MKVSPPVRVATRSAAGRRDRLNPTPDAGTNSSASLSEMTKRAFAAALHEPVKAGRSTARQRMQPIPVAMHDGTGPIDGGIAVAGRNEHVMTQGSQGLRRRQRQAERSQPGAQAPRVVVHRTVRRDPRDPAPSPRGVPPGPVRRVRARPRGRRGRIGPRARSCGPPTATAAVRRAALPVEGNCDRSAYRCSKGPLPTAGAVLRPRREVPPAVVPSSGRACQAAVPNRAMAGIPASARSPPPRSHCSSTVSIWSSA